MDLISNTLDKWDSCLRKPVYTRPSACYGHCLRAAFILSYWSVGHTSFSFRFNSLNYVVSSHFRGFDGESLPAGSQMFTDWHGASLSRARGREAPVVTEPLWLPAARSCVFRPPLQSSVFTWGPIITRCTLFPTSRSASLCGFINHRGGLEQLL